MNYTPWYHYYKNKRCFNISVVSVCTLLCYPAYGKRQPCTVVSVRITELKTHHAERGAAQERIHENA